MGRLNRFNKISGGVRILSALRNPAIIFSVVAAAGCMEAPTESASPSENDVIATAAQLPNDTVGAFLEYEAETPTVLANGVEVGANVSGYFGTGYAGYPHAAGGVVLWRPNVPIFFGKPYTVSFRYSNGSRATAYADVRVNGIVYTALPFPRTGSWSTWSTVSVVQPLAPNLRVIQVTVTSAKGLDLDCVIIE
jgi:hypothetical protein